MNRPILFTSVLVLFLMSCEQNSSVPEIDFHELGFQNSGTAVIGGELHMDAEVLAENRIDVIRVEIHPEWEHRKAAAAAPGEEEWEFATTYTGFSGLKNTHFHEHIEIPLEALPGPYHFHFSVTDREGYQSVFEDEVELLAPAGSK